MIVSPTELPVQRQRLALGLVVLLALVEVPLAFRAGSFLSHLWLPVAIAVAALALVLIVAGPAPRQTGTQVALLGLFLFLGAWTAVSILWAGSRTSAWEEADRTLLYLLGTALAAVAVGWAGPRGLRWLSLGVLATIGVVAAGVIARLAWGEDLLAVFTGGRLSYPVTYHNGQAALLMMGFWLSVCLATARNRAWWLRAALLALAVMLVEIAVLPQSRGALWTFVIVLPWFVVVTPHRFRGLLNLGIVTGLAALSWPALNAVWAEGSRRSAPAVTAVARETAFEGVVHHTLLVILLCGAAAFVLSAAASAVEVRISPLGSRWVRAIGIALLVVALLGAGLGLVALQRAEGDLGTFAQRTWGQVTSDRGPAGGATSRFSELGFSGRLTQWRAAWQAFRQEPLLGLGAQNFDFYFSEHRSTGLIVRHAHSQPMQLLSDLGGPGAGAYALFLLGTVAIGIRTRFRARRPENQAALAAALLAVGSWVVHSSADWLWQLGGVTWPVMLLLGGLLASGSGSETAEGGEPATRMVRATALRVVLAIAALALLISASAFYLSARYVKVAFTSGAPAMALSAADKAESLNPFSPAPAQARADAYRTAARGASDSGAPDGDWAALDALALAVHAFEQAEEREPVNWTHPYQTGLALLDYREAARVARASAGAAGAPPPAPGEALGSPASSAAQREIVADLRTLSLEGIGDLAEVHLQRAKRLNPLETDIDEALAQVATTGG